MSNVQTNHNPDHNAQPAGHDASIDDVPSLVNTVTESFQEYARQRPDVVALWCFGIGFVLGWKLKPW